jgi:hypothetical protein
VTSIAIELLAVEERGNDPKAGETNFWEAVT